MGLLWISDVPSPKKSVPVRFRVSEVGSGSVPGIKHWEPGICLWEPGTRRFPHNSKLRFIKNHYQAVKKGSGNNLIIRTKCCYNEVFDIESRKAALTAPPARVGPSVSCRNWFQQWSTFTSVKSRPFLESIEGAMNPMLYLLVMSRSSFTLQLYTNYTTMSLGKASFSLVVQCASGKSIKIRENSKNNF